MPGGNLNFRATVAPLNRLDGSVGLGELQASCSGSFEAVWHRGEVAVQGLRDSATCEQEEVGEFKGVTFKIANHKPLWQNWAEPTTRYASRPCTPRSTCVPQSVAHFGTIAINIARSRHKMYPVSSPIGVYGPYGRTKRLRGLQRLPVRTSEYA